MTNSIKFLYLSITLLFSISFSTSVQGSEDTLKKILAGSRINDPIKCQELLKEKNRFYAIAAKTTDSTSFKKLDQTCLKIALESIDFFETAAIDSFKAYFLASQAYENLVSQIAPNDPKLLLNTVNFQKNTGQFARMKAFATRCYNVSKGDEKGKCLDQLLYAYAYTETDEEKFLIAYKLGQKFNSQKDKESQFYYYFNELRYYGIRTNFQKVRSILKKMGTEKILSNCYSCYANLKMAQSYNFALEGNILNALRSIKEIDFSKLPDFDKDFYYLSYLEVLPFLKDFKKLDEFTQNLNKILKKPEIFINPRRFFQTAVFKVLGDALQNKGLETELAKDYKAAISQSNLEPYLKKELEFTQLKSLEKGWEKQFPAHAKYIASRIKNFRAVKK